MTNGDIVISRIGLTTDILDADDVAPTIGLPILFPTANFDNVKSNAVEVTGNGTRIKVVLVINGRSLS